MELIDTHQHLISHAHCGYAWTAGVPILANRNFLLADYAALTAGKGVVATLFMETAVDDADYQAEARMAAGLVGQAGMLGQVASCRPEFDAGFDAWLEECDRLHVKGFRRILHESPDDVSLSGTFRRNLRKIGQKGLPFDLCFLARQLPVAAELARACDDQILVLDHCGVPDIAGGGFEEWARGIDTLSAFPHLRLKLSGITRYCAPGTATLENLRPWVDHVLQRFGPQRMLWGGDWPVVNLGVGLPDWIDLSRSLLAGLSPTEQTMIGIGTAKSVYKLA